VGVQHSLEHTIGLRKDGTAIAWGENSNGQCDVPAGETFVQVAADSEHTISLKSSLDSDGDGVPNNIDNCSLYNPDQEDCNGNGIGDICDIDSGLSEDLNQNGIADECECICDFVEDGVVNVNDMLAVIAAWGSSGPLGDGNGDGNVDIEDLLIVLGAWGPCP
jgi:hypothetical protein